MACCSPFCVGSELFFKVLFKALETIEPETSGKEYHLEYGWVRLKSGKMSSREGNVVLGQWLLDEAKSKIEKIMALVVRGADIANRQETAEALALSAVKYSFLRQGIGKDLSFDFDESINIQGNSGPYIMYTYARARSVLAKSTINCQKPGQKSKLTNGTNINPEEIAILRTICRYPEVVVQAARTLDPSGLCTYLYGLAGKFNTFYNKHSILSPDNDKTGLTTQFRLQITQSVSEVIKNGLDLLGLSVVERM